MQKLRRLRNMVFELYLSGDRRKRDLFSGFNAEQLGLAGDDSTSRHRVSTRDSDSEGGIGSDSDDAGGGDSNGRDWVSTRDGDSEGGGGGNIRRDRVSSRDGHSDGGDGDSHSGDRFNHLFGVMQKLYNIPEDAETCATDISYSVGAPEHIESVGSGGRGGGRGGTKAFSRTLVKAFWGKFGGGAGRTSSGGNTSFYRDAGKLRDDHWGTLTSLGPDITPSLLSSELTSGGIRDMCGPLSPKGNPEAPAASGTTATLSSLLLSASGHGSSSSGADGSIDDSGRGASSSTGHGAQADSSIRHGRSFSMGQHGRDNTGSTAATVAASALLYAMSGSRRPGPRTGSGMGASWMLSRASWMLSRHHEVFGSAGGVTGEWGAARGNTPFAAGDEGESGNGASRLQLSEHGVRGLRVVR